MKLFRLARKKVRSAEEALAMGDSVIAMRELVETRLWLTALIFELEKAVVEDEKEEVH